VDLTAEFVGEKQAACYRPSDSLPVKGSFDSARLRSRFSQDDKRKALLINTISMCGKGGVAAGEDRPRLIVSFPSTGGMEVSLHTLGLTRVRHRRRSLGYSGRPRKSETLSAIIDANASLSSAQKKRVPAGWSGRAD